LSKKRKKRRISPRTAWILTIGYFVLGFIVAVLFLNSVDPQTAPGTDPNTGIPSTPWIMFPLVVIFWPVFLGIMLWRMFT
jgi:hypothetical protein